MALPPPPRVRRVRVVVGGFALHPPSDPLAANAPQTGKRVGPVIGPAVEIPPCGRGRGTPRGSRRGRGRATPPRARARRVGRVALVRRVAQQHAEARPPPRRSGSRPRRSSNALPVVRRPGRSSSLLVVAVRLLVAQLHRQQLAAVGRRRRRRRAAGTCSGSTPRQRPPRAGGHDLVERRDRVARADLAGVLRVVVEVLGRAAGGSRSRSADRPPTCAGLNSTWIFTSLAIVTSVPPICSTSTLRASLQRVDVGVVAVALVGELLERRVLEVAHAEAEHGQEHAALAPSPRSAGPGRPGW